MDTQKLFEQVRDLYDQLASPLTKEEAANFLGLIADDAEQKANNLQNEIDREAEDDDDDVDGLSMWADKDDDED